MNETKNMERNKGVLVIYTGGTIGSAPRDPCDRDSPQVVVSWEKLWSAMPELKKLEENGCRIRCVSFETPMDSCNAGPDEWTRMARIISDNYDDYEGFVILHGTDTMAYSASMLSFMLRDLGKPVVLTGAQRSALVDVRNDAIQNFITAILVANPRFSRIPLIPEVVICFGGLILRGNRTIKNETSSYTAYQSPNLEPLGEVGDRIIVNERLVRRRPEPGRRFHARLRVDTHVAPLFVYPGISVETVRNVLEQPGLRAVVVQAYGTGNIPTRPEFIELFRRARRERGIILVIVSQCRRGPVELGMYEASAALMEAGFISAGDITVEAAICKLMSLLGEVDISVEDVEADFQASQAGELSVSQFITRLGDTPEVLRRPEDAEHPSRFRFPGKPVSGHWNTGKIIRALLRFRRAAIHRPEEGPVDIRIFVNLDPDAPLNDRHPNFAGRYKKWSMPRKSLVVFDATEAIQSIISPGERISFTVVMDTPGGALHWESAELALFVKEAGC